MTEPGIGHNQPPAEDPRAPIIARVNALIAAADAWREKVKTITDETTAIACQDFIDQLRAEWQKTEEARKAEKKPWDDGAAAVQAAYNPPLKLLQAAGEAMKPLKASWLTLVDRRQQEAAVEAARVAAEAANAAKALAAKVDTGTATVQETVAAADALAAAKAAIKDATAAITAKPQVQGELGGRASGFRTEWSAKIDDVMKALRYYKDSPKLLQTLQSLADADARRLKGDARIPGVTVSSARVL